ncbi:DUF2878 domain-containing protein [Pseudoalteromonas aurantia]|nr:DUF2878 domain-containing protein [Pseudoalteromonas aurantia]
MNVKLRLITNFILFQTSWFSALFLQEGALIIIAIAIFFMALLAQSRQISFFILVCLLPLSLLFEFIAISIGIVSYEATFVPTWLVGLWVALLLTFNDSFRFMLSLKWWTVALAFAVFGPLSYMAGARFGALTISESMIHYWVLFGAMWATYAALAKFIYQTAVIKFQQR